MLIYTQRLMIRQLRESDVDSLYDVLSDPDVMRCIEPVYTRKQTLQLIRRAGMCAVPLIWALAEKATDRLIGHVIYHPFDETRYEIGWIIAKPYWNCGYAQEITDVLIDYAQNAGVPAIVIECDPKQTVTAHIAQKKGFHLVSSDEMNIYEKMLPQIK